MSAATTIPVSKETRDRLKSIGSKGETYDEICKKLLDGLSEAVEADLIEKKWEQLQREKEKYVPLEEI